MLARLLVVGASLIAMVNSTKPHILLILADDLGYGNVGWTRSRNNCSTPEVQTPNMDALVAEGIELMRFYAYHMCSPSRSSLLSGRLPMHVNVVNADPTIYNASESSGTGAGIPRNMTGLGTKMREAGYRTHMVGKWDAGMATPTHAPSGRGFETALCYFHHGNSYWLQQTGDTNCPVGVDLWDAQEGAAHSIWNSSGCESKPGQDCDSNYEEVYFRRRFLRIVSQHDPTEAPLFLYYAPHLVHDPLQVEPIYLEMMTKAGGGAFDNETETSPKFVQRWTYHAMVKALDDQVGNLTAAVKAKQMWKDTLLWFASDNGGPIYGGANNHPLRGGKYSEFEGGVRVASFVSGGFIVESARGKLGTGLGTLSDVWGTLCALAMVDPTDHTAAAVQGHLPPVDGMDLSAMITGRNLSDSPRQMVPMMPLSGSDLQALDAWDALRVSLRDQSHYANSRNLSDVTFQVEKDHTCRNPVKHYDFATHIPSVDACEARCAASQPACVAFEWAHEQSQWCALYNTSCVSIAAGAKFDTGCRGHCSVPPPPGPPGPPVPPKQGKCMKQQGVGFADANHSVVVNVKMNDCCGLCATASPACAASQWVKDPHPNGDSHANGTCILKSSRNSPINDRNAAAFFPSGVLPPAPVIRGQAGLILGDWKIVTGVSVNDAIYTGAHFPNRTTPAYGAAGVQVPAFTCSSPAKRACLFHILDDQTEHNDLAAAMPDKVDEMIAALQNVSHSFFNPHRGLGDNRSCIAALKNGVTALHGTKEKTYPFFVPWLELPPTNR